MGVRLGTSICVQRYFVVAVHELMGRTRALARLVPGRMREADGTSAKDAALSGRPV